MRKHNTWKAIKEYNKLFNQKERERLSKIRDFEVGEEVVIITSKGIEIPGIIKRVNQKTYTVEFGDDSVRIDKERLLGIPKSVLEDITGDGRRFVGAGVRLKKKPE